MLSRYSLPLLLLLICLPFVQSVQGQKIVNSFPSPGSEPRGLTWDGTYLWCADASTGSVYKVDPSDGTVISSFPFSIQPDYGGITLSDDGNMWIANGSLVSKVNPINGEIVHSFSCPGG